MGRPSEYSEEVADEILGRLIKPESLRSICRDQHMPDIRTVMRWLLANEEFCQHYARAREIQADVIADETQEIADDGSNDWMENNKPDAPGWKENGEAIQRSRLRFDQRRWYLSKLAPKKYGEKTTTELTGADGGPIVSQISAVTDERLAKVLSMMAAADKQLDG